MRYFLFSFSLLFLIGCQSSAQKQDLPKAFYAHENFDTVFHALNKKVKDSTILSYAQLLRDSAYVGKTLELGNDFAPVVNIHQFDCLTFVENGIAFTKSQGNEAAFIHWIEEIRYRDGEAQGYTTRLHYFSDWIRNNVEKGIVKDITCEIGGEPIQFQVNFMSKHPQYYPQLKADSTLIAKMAVIESSINQTTFCYIPKEKVVQVEDKIMEGDILGITTNIAGLDYAHNGLAIHQNGRIYMLHASSDFKKVMITQEPLSDYLMQMKHMTGISVLRLR